MVYVDELYGASDSTNREQRAKAHALWPLLLCVAVAFRCLVLVFVFCVCGGEVFVSVASGVHEVVCVCVCFWVVFMEVCVAGGRDGCDSGFEPRQPPGRRGFTK